MSGHLEKIEIVPVFSVYPRPFPGVKSVKSGKQQNLQLSGIFPTYLYETKALAQLTFTPTGLICAVITEHAL